jgi:Kef-type K+ transport system membrane component KefB/nucleotide-binding universal stress UspA family protein
MDVFSAASHDDVLVLVVQVAILLASARLLGELALRLKQPAVVGEILAGIILGPSLLSSLFPVVGQWVIPQTEVQGYLLEVVSLIGVMFLLLITGLETDLRLIRRHARTALSVSWGGILVTFGTGMALGFLLPDFLLVDPDSRLVFALFVGTAMSISAIPVIAKVLMDLNLIRRDVGQTILAAGMSDDTIGWILLSTVAGIAAGEAVTTGSVLATVASVLAFLILSITVGRWLLGRALAYVQDEMISTDRLLTLVVVMAFAFGAISQALHLEAILGAFVAGIIFGQMPRLPREVHHRLETIALGVFAPIFFAVAGLKVNIQSLFTPTLLLITAIVITIATLGKVVGTYAGARLIGRKDHWTALSFGAGLNARGAMEIIIASIGLSLGVLTQDMFSIIVVMAIATSLMAPFALRWVLRRVVIGDEEAARLRMEELAQGSLVAGIYRVLLPVRLQPDAKASTLLVEARLMEKLNRKNRLSITLLTIGGPEERESTQEFLGHLQELFSDAEVVTKIISSGANPSDAILHEAKKDYDLLVLGAPRQKGKSNRVIFSRRVDEIVRAAPCPTVIVHGHSVPEGWQPDRILVPTNGSSEARNAAELAFYMADPANDTVHVVNVLQEDELAPSRTLHFDEASVSRRHMIAHGIIDELRELGESLGVSTSGEAVVASTPERGILDAASNHGVDLIVMGTGVRPGGLNLFLGPRVERILATSDRPVVVFNT